LDHRGLLASFVPRGPHNSRGRFVVPSTSAQTTTARYGGFMREAGGSLDDAGAAGLPLP
jgi:hypothetical protein